MNSPHDPVTVTIDSRSLSAARGATILEIARAAGLYIPTLCAHKDLTPYGGCRMCIVEVDGMRGFPTACTTPAESGMVIRTHTAQLHEIRTEILRLILSEHPCSCLVCDEQDECRQYSATIRKAGVTTGCRYCPNDGQCELQEVAARLGITEIGYPVYYRNLPVHKDDPFFDRDYNLCILCGRCVRMCQEIRTAGTLTFLRRGPQTVIGPAFDRTHLEAGCEFCGACVSVCPTGALAEKARKWKGAAEREVTTTCPFCGVGCQVRLQVKKDEVVGALPAEDDLVNRGQLCVKGRFCIPEIVSHPRRLRHAYKLRDGVLVDIGWEEAATLAAERLTACPPEEFGLLVSANCSNEDLYVAQKFARAVMRSNNIDTTFRLAYGASCAPYVEHLRAPATLEDLRRAEAVIAIGLDTRFGRSVIGAELRKAFRRGARIVTIHHRPHDLAQIAAHWLRPAAGQEGELLRELMAATAPAARGGRGKTTGGADIAAAAGTIRESGRTVILLGPMLLDRTDGPDLLRAVHAWAAALGAAVMPLPSQNNFLGALLMGAVGELLPGGAAWADTAARDRLARRWQSALPAEGAQWNSSLVGRGPRRKVLYLLGEVIPNPRAGAETVIFQNIFHPPDLTGADLVLPAAAFSETDGTVINGEGRVQRLHRALDPPGDAAPDWEIVCRIARAMGAAGFAFGSAREIHEEIATLIEGFDAFDAPARAPHRWPLAECDLPAAASAPRSDGSATNPFLLLTTNLEHTHRGFAMADRVAGLSRLYPLRVVEMNPVDARTMGIADGETVAVTAEGLDRCWPVCVTAAQPEGLLHVVLPPGELDGANPRRVQVRKCHV
ncbi:MAG TPA: molybdopterin-dependent oxidoreductase [candidate division Zixibacteria bacterium]|nr:molybdopterin-dependent oxidoreductase [candidate division Zixibacteria bacterium]MDD4916499.1 molybdopterin-dependent oxidoreductase [candidate division Zixibacteria bacterium]MDM7973359.1 molybdopterin-dependent oxidoreductase [candidate division Zixibacteria bacterium]HOD65076.1 molybdopterin-dependent oxidoreductase [candidate division Zixibacteria bacterium]HOZ06876.1 molybdopterin-dependent oxidoreductase [candidate division Zixibacteria bacterium]